MIDNHTEKQTGRAADVVRQIANLFSSNPTEVVDYKGKAVGGPFQSRKIGISLPDGKKVIINAFKFLNEDDISITVSNKDLRPLDPMYHMRPSYRVDIKGGEAAKSYADTIGFSTGQPTVDRHGNIISDNWTETENSPEEIISILKNGIPFRP
jgi:hypothetical protein